jgi:regulator of replication initiation timing
MTDKEVEAIASITTQVPGYYKCGHCALHFKTRSRFRTHESTCLSLKQIRARATFGSEPGVSVQDLFALVQRLAVRLETAEHELSVLKRQNRQQMKREHNAENKIHRDNLLQWLNESASASSASAQIHPFSEWLTAIDPMTREHLALVFQNGFMDGMCAIIASIAASASSASSSSSCAICAYDEAPDTLFVYDSQGQDQDQGQDQGQDQPKWRTMTRSEFEKFINRMQKLLMNEFVRWQQENKERWHDPDFAEQYDANLLKVMGSGKAKSGGCSNRDMLMTRMKPKVYAAIKQSANNSEVEK